MAAPVGESTRRWRVCCDEGAAHILVDTHTQFQLQRSHSSRNRPITPSSQVLNSSVEWFNAALCWDLEGKASLCRVALQVALVVVLGV